MKTRPFSAICPDVPQPGRAFRGRRVASVKPLLPPLEGKSVLDLGCGYGWHCQFAVEQGARQVLGIDD